MINKSWLQDNIAPLLALCYTFFAFYIFRMVLLKEVKATENVVFLVISGVINIIMLIVGYFFGSSAGSKAKQLSLDKLNGSMTNSDTTKIIDSSNNNINQDPQDETQPS